MTSKGLIILSFGPAPQLGPGSTVTLSDLSDWGTQQVQLTGQIEQTPPDQPPEFVVRSSGNSFKLGSQKILNKGKYC